MCASSKQGRSSWTSDAQWSSSTAAATSAGLRRGRVDAAGEPAERQGLDEHAPRSGQRGEEEALAAEERGLDPADELDVVADALVEGDV